MSREQKATFTEFTLNDVPSAVLLSVVSCNYGCGCGGDIILHVGEIQIRLMPTA